MQLQFNLSKRKQFVFIMLKFKGASMLSSDASSTRHAPVRSLVSANRGAA